MDDSLSIKILVVGNSGVGKTALLNRICSETFSQNTEPTVGCDISLKVLKNFRGHNIRLQLWEAAGIFDCFGLAKNYRSG